MFQVSIGPHQGVENSKCSVLAIRVSPSVLRRYIEPFFLGVYIRH